MSSIFIMLSLQHAWEESTVSGSTLLSMQWDFGAMQCNLGYYVWHCAN